MRTRSLGSCLEFRLTLDYSAIVTDVRSPLLRTRLLTLLTQQFCLPYQFVAPLRRRCVLHQVALCMYLPSHQSNSHAASMPPTVYERSRWARGINEYILHCEFDQLFQGFGLGCCAGMLMQTKQPQPRTYSKRECTVSDPQSSWSPSHIPGRSSP